MCVPVTSSCAHKLVSTFAIPLDTNRNVIPSQAEGAGLEGNKFNVTVPLPRFLLEDDEKERDGAVEEGQQADAGADGGWKDQKIDLAYTDFVAVALGVVLVAIDYTGHHNVFTANNLIGVQCAHLIARFSVQGNMPEWLC